MNIGSDPGAVSSINGSHNLEVRVTRRLSIPQVFIQTSPEFGSDDNVKKPHINSSNTTGKDFQKSPSLSPGDCRHSYEFEKVIDSMHHFHDSLEDKAARDSFRPKRQYMSHQRRRRRTSLSSSSLLKKKVQDGPQRRGSLPEKLKMARKSFHNSLPNNLDFQTASSSPLLEMVDCNLTAFERQRKKHQKEEGTIYATTRATERAIRSWKRQTIVLGPLGLVSDEDDNDTVKESQKRRQSSLLVLLEKDASKHNDAMLSVHQDDVMGVDKVKDEKPSETNEEGKVQDVSTAQNIETTVPAKGEALPVADNGPDLAFAIDPQVIKEQKLREVFQRQKEIAKKKDQDAAKTGHEEKATASKAPPLMRLVLMENSMHGSEVMPSKASDKTEDKEQVSSEDAAKAAVLVDERALLPKRDYMQRRSSAPNFASTTVAVLTHASTPEEALKEMVALPKDVLADLIISAPDNTSNKGGTNSAASNEKNNNNINGEKKKGKKKNNRRSANKKSRRSSMPDLSKVAKEDIYDWAMNAKQKDDNNSNSDGVWKHIVSDANAVRRPPDDIILPPKPTQQTTSVNSCLPKLEALLHLVESKR